MQSRAGKKRSGSDAFQTFDQKTINEFKEAFGIMDQNKDGYIDKSDLKDLYASMGTCCVVGGGRVRGRGYKHVVPVPQSNPNFLLPCVATLGEQTVE